MIELIQSFMEELGLNIQEIHIMRHDRLMILAEESFNENVVHQQNASMKKYSNVAMGENTYDDPINQMYFQNQNVNGL